MQHESPDLRWFTAFYGDLLTWYPDERVEILRDQRVATRKLNEGALSFFTQDLPKMHSCVLEALESTSPPPEFSHLGWLVKRIWYAPSPYDRAFALRAHRQICHALYKLEIPYEERTLLDSYQGYLSTEEDLQYWSDKIDHSIGTLCDDLDRARYILGRAIPPIFSVGSLPRTTVLRDCLGMTPRHGPGSVATGERGDDKWRFKRLYRSLHSRFPYYDWFLCRGADNLLDQIQWYRGLQRLDEPCSKVVPVPKDSRGPRLISEEPLELQYVQQGYLRLMMRMVEHSTMCGNVLFDDQSKHRALALASSKDRRYATIDLKDASDRVTLSLVSRIFPIEIAKDLVALRSTHSLLQGVEVPLRKMSPMGSSVCFPTMAITLWTLCALALEHHTGEEFSRRKHGDQIYIFGDDIIVPVDLVPWVYHVLGSVGLRVNKTKSYSASNFRESCGMDAFHGVDVTPTRIRHALGLRAPSDELYLSALAAINQLRAKDWIKTADALERKLKSVCKDPIPYTWDTEDFPGIVVDRSRALNVPTRWSHARSSLMAYAPIPIGKKVSVKVRGRARLLRNLTQGPGEHPDVTTVRGDVRMRKAWVRVSRTPKSF